MGQKIATLQHAFKTVHVQLFTGQPTTIYVQDMSADHSVHCMHGHPVGTCIHLQTPPPPGPIPPLPIGALPPPRRSPWHCPQSLPALGAGQHRQRHFLAIAAGKADVGLHLAHQPVDADLVGLVDPAWLPAARGMQLPAWAVGMRDGWKWHVGI